jgi:ferredoxin
MRVEADREVCVGAGMCALTAPAAFTQDDTDGRVVLLAHEPSPADEAAVREAAGLCPSGAISASDG